MIRQPYDASSLPPAPSLTVRIGAPRHPDRWVQRQAILDTGSDICCVPTALLIELGAGRAYQTTTRDFEGNKSDGVVYLARLAFGDYEFNYLNVLGIAGNTVLIGRDILNELDVRLDGPNRTLTIS